MYLLQLSSVVQSTPIQTKFKCYNPGDLKIVKIVFDKTFILVLKTKWFLLFYYAKMITYSLCLTTVHNFF